MFITWQNRLLQRHEARSPVKPTSTSLRHHEALLPLKASYSSRKATRFSQLFQDAGRHGLRSGEELRTLKVRGTRRTRSVFAGWQAFTTTGGRSELFKQASNTHRLGEEMCLPPSNPTAWDARSPTGLMKLPCQHKLVVLS